MHKANNTTFINKEIKIKFLTNEFKDIFFILFLFSTVPLLVIGGLASNSNHTQGMDGGMEKLSENMFDHFVYIPLYLYVQKSSNLLKNMYIHP